MTINCFELTDRPELKPCEYSYAIDTIQNKNARIWIDLQDIEPSELEGKLDDVQVHGLIRRFCLESRDHPGYYPLHPLALMVVPVQTEIQDTEKVEYLSLLFSHDFLISIRNSKMARFQTSISLEDTAELLPDDSIAGIISSLLMGLSLDFLRKASRMGDRILVLEEQMDRDPDSVKIEEISDKRSELLTLESIVQGQLPILEAVIISKRASIISDNTVEYLSWTAANLNAANRKLDWLEHRIEVIRSLIDMYAQDKTNRRLGRLTILSMIFMPITFLAGIWGMNFDFMPGLHFKFGYLMALIVMFLIVLGMFFYFRKRGWFN